MNNTYNELDEQVVLLLRLLFRGAKVTEVRLEEAFRAERVTKAKMEALQHLVEASEPLPLGQLAERLRCGKSNATTLVDRLEADGFVERLHEPDNRRTVLARITPQGQQAYRTGIQALKQVQYELLEHSSMAERAQLIALLTRLIALWE
jgi:DNA-binding MarR family transcriptional regulator